MIKPFRFDDLFKINPNANVVIKNNIIIIDNFFSDFDSVSEYTYNNNVEIWKYDKNSRNFIDYYDCRHGIFNWWNTYSNFDATIISVIYNYFKLNVMATQQEIEFNYFKHAVRGVDSKFQFHPHKDYDFNLLVYLDHQANGGTAIYDIDGYLKNREHENLLYDVSGLKKTIIEARPNRCVIFNGKQYHGGHIDDHDVYYDNWRINLVRFYECILPGS